MARKRRWVASASRKKCRSWIRNKIADKMAGQERSGNEIGYVYLCDLGMNGWIMIGRTKNVQERQKAFHTINPKAKIVDCYRVRNPRKVEALLHKTFKKVRVSGAKEIYMWDANNTAGFRRLVEPWLASNPEVAHGI